MITKSRDDKREVSLTNNKTKDKTDQNRDSLIPCRTFNQLNVRYNKSIGYFNDWTPISSMYGMMVSKY